MLLLTSFHLTQPPGQMDTSTPSSMSPLMFNVYHLRSFKHKRAAQKRCCANIDFKLIFHVASWSVHSVLLNNLLLLQAPFNPYLLVFDVHVQTVTIKEKFSIFSSH